MAEMGRKDFRRFNVEQHDSGAHASELGFEPDSPQYCVVRLHDRIG